MTVDVLIVGAGPAGMAAAVLARRGGLSVVVADENPTPGGQIYRAVRAGPLAGSDILGGDHAAGRELAEAFLASGAEHLPGATVFMVEPAGEGGFEVGLVAAGGARIVAARHVVIATGALERPFPIPGWTLPGVMTAGAAQTLLKASGAVPEEPAVLAGSGPLLYLLAAQYARAGVRLAAVLDTTPRGNWRRALRHLPGFLVSPYFRKGLGLLREALAAHNVVRNVTELAAEGIGALSHVRCRANGRSMVIPARLLLLHQGVAPQINLAMATGVSHAWRDERLAFEPRLTAEGETNLPGLFVAGDSGGIGGAEAARAQGSIAAAAILTRCGIEASRELAAARAALGTALRGRAFLDALYRPADRFRMPADDVIICRCEEVTAGEIRRLTAAGAQGPNQAKALCRAGMGACQGRSCGLTVCEIMAASSGRSRDDIGHMRLRAPVKPVTVGEMAALTLTDCRGS
jgi:NADPH-dependent 2,4-dienoyl-CoA reductase/sulfur reductase-like enzyme